MNVIFFYPSSNVGGVQTLFARLAVSLIERVDSVTIYDYPDGIYQDLIFNDKVNILPFVDGDIISLEQSVTIITPASNLVEIYNKFHFKSNDSILFWMVHPFNIVVNLPLFNYFSKLSTKNINRCVNLLYKAETLRLKSVIELLSNNSGLVYMDYECFDINQKIFNSNVVKPIYLPIPTTDSNKRKSYNVDGSYCWLGRVEDFKTNILVKVIDDFLKCFTCDAEKKFVVIGLGKDIDKVKLKYSKNDNVVFVDRLLGDELYQYLVDNISIMFAMGTSALESAKLGIPTILLDACYSTLPSNYCYRWLYQSKGYTLGRILDRDYKPSHDDISFPEIVNILYTDFDVLSQKCFLYYRKHHSLDACTDSLLNLLNNLKKEIDNNHLLHDYCLDKTILYRVINVLKKLVR
jgi:glycosyltransferase involved in cell wall biosynthesis